MTAVHFNILGPLEVTSGGRHAELQVGKERALLAILLTESGRVVSIDRLVDELWGDDPPASAHASLRVLISRLRKALAALGVGDGIQTRAPGYVLDLEPEWIDAVHFEALANRGRKELADGRPTAAAATLREALDLWRGAALADAGESPAVRAEAARLEEARLAVLEDRINADLHSGRHDVVVSELEKYLARHPLRERLWRSMMIALYRSGRQSEALNAFQTLRRLLVEEMGIEPSTSLSELHRAILQRLPELDWREPARASHVETPLQMPTGVVTFLLTDVEGSTRLWDADHKATSRAIEIHETIIATAVADHDGTLMKSKGEGDSCVAVFRRASDAAAAAVAAQRAMAAERWPAEAEIRVRIALHTGEAELRQGDYFGRTINRAARLRGLARGGEVLCSRATADLVADDLPEGARLVDVGIRQLAGIARPEHVFEISFEGADTVDLARQQTVAAAELPPQLQAPAETIFVGRDAERTRLRAAWTRAVAGQRQVVLIAGEPGIGKTRLAADLASEVHASGATVLYGGCDEDMGSPYHLFVEALRTLIATCPPEVLAQRAGRIGVEIGRLLPEAFGRQPGTMAPADEPESERRRLFDSVNALLGAGTGSRPILLVLDDLHWADQGSLLLLRFLAKHPLPGSLLVVATYRDVEVTPAHPLADALVDLRRAGIVERLSLTGLSSENIGTLLSERAGGDLGPAALAFIDVLRSGTGGNPFFIEEIVRHLSEAGVAYGRGTFLPTDDVGIPEGIRDVIGRRVARLPDSVQEALTVAAVMGREFHADALEALGDHTEEELVSALDAARDAGLITEIRGRVGSYAFKHSLVRETLYQGLSTLRRARLHRRVGEALERAYGDRPSLPLSELAHHFLEAASSDPDKAIRYALSAGEHALSQLAFEEAAGHYERALEVLEGLTADPERQGPVLLRLGDAWWRAGNVQASRTAFGAAMRAARASGDVQTMAGAAVGLGRGTGGLTRSVGVDEELVELLEETVGSLGDEDRELRTRVLASMADVLYYTNQNERKAALAAEAVALAENLGDPSALLVARYSHVWAQIGPDGNLDEQLSSLAEVIDLAKNVGNQELSFEAHLIRGQMLVEAVRFEEADREIESATSIADEVGLPRFRPWLSAYRSLRSYLAGRFGEADALIQEAISAGSGEDKDPEAAALSFGGQAMVQMLHRQELAPLIPTIQEWVRRYPNQMVMRCVLAYIQGDAGLLSEAQRTLDSVAEGGFSKLPRVSNWTTSMWALGHCAAACGDERRVAEIYDLLVPFRDRWVETVGVWMVFGPVSTALGTFAAAVGRWDEAEAHLEAASAQAELVPAPPYIAEADYRIASMLARRGRPRDRSRARAARARASELAAALGMGPLRQRIEALEI